MKVLFMGTPDFAVGTLEKILEAGHEVVGVVTQPDKVKGRGKSLQFPPVKESALAHDLPVYQPARIRNHPEVLEELAALQPDVAVVVAFGQILPQEFLDMPKYGCLNVHASLLPAYRGAAPIQWSIIDGLSETGVTIMQMDAGLDTGDILSQVTVPIDPEETGDSLFEKLSSVGAQALVDILPDVEAGNLHPVKQGEPTTAYAKQLKKEMGDIHWEESAAHIALLVRGLASWPSAYTKVNGKTCKIWKAQALESLPDGAAQPAGSTDPQQPDQQTLQPGQVALRDKKQLIIACGEGFLSLLEVQMEGKRRMEIAEFLRGIHEIQIGG